MKIDRCETRTSCLCPLVLITVLTDSKSPDVTTWRIIAPKVQHWVYIGFQISIDNWNKRHPLYLRFLLSFACL